MRIAIPTNSPGGEEAERSDHFGHCDVFTVVDLGDDSVVHNVEIIPNGDHAKGGCLVPVKILQDAGVEAIVVGGMGAKPMQGFTQAGITVYFANRDTAKTVKVVVEKFVQNQLPTMHSDQVCKGAGNCHH